MNYITNNYVTHYDGYYISYNPFPIIGYEGEETALVKETKRGTKFYILIGDFREDYAKCKDYKECKKFFDSKKELKGTWSN